MQLYMQKLIKGDIHAYERCRSREVRRIINTNTIVVRFDRTTIRTIVVPAGRPIS